MNPPLEDYYTFRDTLAEAVIRDLVGPMGDQEPEEYEQVLTEPPMQRYIAGVLYPQVANETGGIREDNIDPEQDGDQNNIKYESDDSAGESQTVSLASMRYPSALGFSCSVDIEKATTLTINVTAATYSSDGSEVEEAESDNLERGGDDDEGDASADPGAGRQKWTRHPVSFSRQVPLTGKPSAEDFGLGQGLKLYVKQRKPVDGEVAVTVVLLNTREHTKGKRDSKCFFQCELAVDTGGANGFVDRTKKTSGGVDDDARSAELLYRNSYSFAIGHGTGVQWPEEHTDGRVDRIWTTPAPSHDLLLAQSNPDIKSEYFSMRKLADDDRSAVVAGLRSFASDYQAWIDSRRHEIADLDARYHDTAESHLDDCDEAARRIGDGITALEQHDDVWRAFQLANEAMQEQRVRAEWAREGRDGEPDSSSEKHSWRAFQLGFILMALPGVADRESDDRKLVDLLWFPTGGGKTEAYLGLIAFTIFLRRLRGVAGGGTGAGLTVIMRYTLRLLTLQQYQRAAMLICACENIRRREETSLGHTPISLCLWVGGAATPNDLAEAEAAIKKGSKVSEGNPVQLNSCPWCAEPLSARNYWVADSNRRLVISCPNRACDFTKGLPCYVVDEDVYSQKPTLMIATVDKFASLPWRDKMGDLFNVDSEEPPPELIIQDELHLISGPLGTMVGLYESAIEMMCVDGAVGPKVIASTATIRRATEQIQQLYAGEARQFPPPGLDATDSYFAVEAPRSSQGTRRYLGLMAPGTSHATLLVRTYAALLQRAAELPAEDEVADPYWTLLGYFNSLRILGAAYMQIRDDVLDRMGVLAGQSKAPARFKDPKLKELTSRAGASEVPDILDQLSEMKGSAQCLDVLLATNMISVGVDVDRLGLMAVMGQPQSSSEYIQATSRVGRKHPGLVMVLLNAARSRDRSHYEDFVGFHNSIYRRVDATSLTPFAARARDRGLHAVFFGMMRAKYKQFQPNNGARDMTDIDAKAATVIAHIVERVKKLDKNEDISRGEAEAVERQLLQVVEAWKRKAADQPNLVFRHQDPTLALLSDAAHPELADRYDSFSTMWSMRSVDTQSGLYLVK